MSIEGCTSLIIEKDNGTLELNIIVKIATYKMYSLM